MKRIESVMVIICGKLRMTHTVYHHMEQLFRTLGVATTEYVLSTDTEDDTESEYSHRNDLNILKSCPKIRRVCFQSRMYGNEFRNARNYFEKVVAGCDLVRSSYDLYIIIRSDLIIDDPHAISELAEEDTLYVPTQNHNSYLMGVQNKINGNLILTRSIDHILSISKMRCDDDDNIDFFDVMLYKKLCILNIPVKQIEVPSHLLLSLCHVVAISGDSGSGKSTLSDALCDVFSDDVLKLETDRYHKWERGDTHYRQYTHLNPNANFLEKLEDDVYNLRIGNHIFSVDYDHDTGKFTPEEKINPSNNIVLCGLHTLWSSRLRSMLNLKIYMDTDDELRTLWKTSRDVQKRSKSHDDVIKELQRRKDDSKNFIETQRNEADVIIRFFLGHGSSLQCECAIRHSYNFMLCTLIRAGYSYSIGTDCALNVRLNGTPNRLLEVMTIPEMMLSKIRCCFYGELQLLIFHYSTMSYLRM